MPKLLTTFKEFLAKESSEVPSMIKHNSKVPDMVSSGDPTSDYYPVHIDPKSLNPKHKYTNKAEYDKTKDLLVKHLNSVGLGDHAKNIFTMEKDDISIATPDYKTADIITSKLNTVLPQATAKFRGEYGVKHNAHMSGKYSADGGMFYG